MRQAKLVAELRKGRLDIEREVGDKNVAAMEDEAVRPEEADGRPLRSMPPKSPSLAITRPCVGSSTIISLDWLQAIQRLSCSSIFTPSGPPPIRLTKTSGVPGSSVEPVTGILTMVSFDVLATNKAVILLLNARPLAPMVGGIRVASAARW